MTRAFDLGSVEAIPLGEGRTFDAGTRRIAVFRARTGEVFATQAECPHKRGPLSDGIVGEHTLVCPLHGYKFDLLSGAPLGHDCGALAVHAAHVDERGHAIVAVDEEDG